MAFIVLQVYTAVNVFKGSTLGFYQYKNLKWSQILSFDLDSYNLFQH